MWATNLKILAIVFGTIGLYTLIANAIPQVESDVPEELSFTGEVSAAELVKAGEELYSGAGGCTACHGLGTRAPNLLGSEGGMGAIGARCYQRIEGTDCKTYLHQSLVDPGAHMVEGFQPIMPDMDRTLTPSQIWAMVAYLQSQGGDVTVTAADIQASGEGAGPEAAGAAPAPGGAAGGTAAATDPRELLTDLGCINCHQLGDEGQAVGPPFTGIGSRRDAVYIRQSILDPAADLTEGYQQFAGVMPTNFGERLTAAQLESIVNFLVGQR